MGRHGYCVVAVIDELPGGEERTSKQHCDDHKDYFGSVVRAVKITRRIRARLHMVPGNVPVLHHTPLSLPLYAAF